MTETRPPEHFERAPLSELLAEAEARAETELARLGPPVETALGLLFGPLDPTAAAARTRRCVRNSVRNDLVQILRVHRRFPELLERFRCHGAEPLLDLRRAGQGALVLFAHVGPRSGVGAALSRLGVPAMGLRQGTAGAPLELEGIELCRAAPGSPESLLFLKRAAARLREGGCVLQAVDGELGTGHQEQPCLGRRLPFARGPFVLQELTGAAVVPVTVRWAEDGAIDAWFEPPLCPPGSGARLQPAEVAAWLEARLREDPAQMRLNKLRDYVALPLAEGPAGTVHRISSSGYAGGPG